ncbi:MAG: cyclic nucleotide-binding domain-containing protein [bacterium]
MSEETLDFFDRIPERAIEIEATELNRPWTEERWLLTHPETTKTFTLTDDAKAIWDGIDGERTVRDLLATVFEKRGSPVDIEALLGRLEKESLIRWKEGLSLEEEEAEKIDQGVRRVLGSLIRTEFSLPFLSSFLNRFGRRWGVLVVSTNMILVLFALGLVACYWLILLFSPGNYTPPPEGRSETLLKILHHLSWDYTPLRVGGSVLLGLVGLAICVVVLPFIAEFLFGLGIPRLNLRIREVAVRFRFGYPSLRVRSEDPVSLFPNAFTRLLLARTATYLGMAGVAILLAALLTLKQAFPFGVDALRQITVMALLLCFLSLSPLLPTQTYRSLCGYLHVTALRRLAFQYLGRELAGFFGRSKDESVHGKILLAFAAYTCVWSIVAAKLASIIFRSELPLLLADALSEENRAVLAIALLALSVAAAGILFFVLGSIFFVVWKIAHWVWTHVYPKKHAHKILVNVPVFAGLALLISLLPWQAGWQVIGVIVPLLFTLSVLFLAAAAIRLAGSIWVPLLWGMTVASAGFAYGFAGAQPGMPGLPFLAELSGSVLLVAALLAIGLKTLSISGTIARLFLSIVVITLSVAFARPSWLFLLSAIFAARMAVLAWRGSLFPVWLSVVLSCLCLYWAAVMGTMETTSIIPPGALIAAALWLNAAFGFRHLLANPPTVLPTGVRRLAHSDRERLVAAYLDLRALLREALAAHVGGQFCHRYEQRAGGGIESEEEPEKTDEIAALAVHLNDECRAVCERVRGLVGRHLLPELVSAVLHRIFWMEREVLLQHVPEVARTGGREKEEAIDARELLVRLPLFSGLDDERRMEVASLFRRREVPKSKKVITQGEPGHEFYVIASGTAAVEVEDSWGQQRTVAHLSDGDYFGEVALLQNVPRTATVVAQTPLSLFVVGRQDFRTHLTDVSTLSESIQVSVDRVNVLRGISLFRRLPPALLSKVASWFEQVRVKAGEVVIREGDRGEAFYVILKGSCQVAHRRDETTEEELARLGSGEFFGEISLILQRPTTATVRAIEVTELLRLPEERFLAIFRENTFFAESLSQIATRRVIDTTGRISGAVD